MAFSFAFDTVTHKEHNYIHSYTNRRQGTVQVCKLGKDLAEKRQQYITPKSELMNWGKGSLPVKISQGSPILMILSFNVFIHNLGTERKM